MAKFVAGSKQKPTIVLNEPADLVRWVKSVLDTLAGKAWYISVEEHTGFVISHGRAGRKSHDFVLSVRRDDWTGFSCFHIADSLVALAKRFQEKGWPEILVELEKRAKGDPVKVHPINPEHSIESRAPTIEHVRRALPAPKQLSLTHKPATASKQLLFPQPSVACCNWPGCTTPLTTKVWGCPRHWQALTADLRELISQTYRPGEIPGSDYLEVMAHVRKWAAIGKG